MKISFLLLAVVAVGISQGVPIVRSARGSSRKGSMTSGSKTSNSKDLRLIETAPGVTRWVTEDELIALVNTSHKKGKGVGFFDITGKSSWNFGKTEASPYPNPPPIPQEPHQQDYVTSLFSSIDRNRIFSIVQKLSTFKTRYFKSDTGVEAAQDIAQLFSVLRGTRDDVSVESVLDNGFPQTSVIASFEGNVPSVSSEVVVIGCHLDSVGTNATARSPGADDDGSGVATVIEAFRVLVENEFRPDRTVEFHAYAGEEAGLRGSSAIAESYAREGKKVVSMLQLDMDGYVAPKDPRIGIVTDFVDPQLSSFVKKIIKAYTTISAVDTKCGYACSDHASWTKTGYRSAFPFETSFELDNPHIHSANDVPSDLSKDRLVQFTRLALGYLVEMATV